jgi:hypothetical protein
MIATGSGTGQSPAAMFWHWRSDKPMASAVAVDNVPN